MATIIEVALNGPWGRARQPGIPCSVDEIVADGIACARAGASVLHVHAYETPDTQSFDADLYARIIEGIRAVEDVPVYPSIPTTGTGLGPDTMGSAARYAHLDVLGARGLLELAVIDPGSVNFTAVEPGDSPGGTYLNTEADIRHGLVLAVRHKFHPAYAIYEPGFTRAGAALAEQSNAPTPLCRFMFSDHFAWGFPPDEGFLDAHVNLHHRMANGAPWMVGGLGVDIRALIEPAVRRGGHVRVGLEDAPLGTSLSNSDWVDAAVSAIRDAGSEPATPAEARAYIRGTS